MDWININDVEILLAINRKRLGEDPEQEIHVGHTNENGLWIIGNQFGFDMGEVTHWQKLPELPSA